MKMIRAGNQLAIRRRCRGIVCHAAVFDTLFATSVRNDAADTTRAPLMRSATALCLARVPAADLEDLEYARARGATIYAEIVGFGTNSDGCHVTHPNAQTMKIAMELALADAELSPSAIGYINAHGTGTQYGDIAGIAGHCKLVRQQYPNKVAEELHGPYARRMWRFRSMVHY